jgi:hypothetical protein
MSNANGMRDFTQATLTSNSPASLDQPPGV